LIEKQAKMPNHTPGSENVFKDLGLPNPDERLAKAKLAYKINRLITDQGMTQKAAADFLGLSRSKMTNLRNSRLRNLMIDHLFSLLAKLDYHIEMRVSPKSNRDTQESIDVAVI
jgi:predicted XRE-type DNA-binding protein